jgi:FkbM family methyltransferase
MRFRGYNVRIADGPSFYILYKDIFVQRIYHFDAPRRDPFILDCGSNIGMSILYFKHIYPRARIIGFEPDPAIFSYLRENVDRNGLRNVELVQAALAREEGAPSFLSDGKCGSRLAEYGPIAAPNGVRECRVRCVRLRDYLNEGVDFLKINIEGAEWPVLLDCDGALKNVGQMVIEYHHLPGLPRTLHMLLALLHRNGFEYLVNSFDSETSPNGRPPFRLTAETRHFLLVYARRLD